MPDYDPYHFREANLAPTDAKRQHYVPRHYLEAFADDGQISVLDLQTSDSYVTNTINAGVESFFYDLRYEQEQLSTESWFANEIETPFWPLFARLRDGPADLLTLSDVEEPSWVAMSLPKGFACRGAERTLSGYEKSFEPG